MEYFVMYDNNDNVVCYLDNLDEFLNKYNYQRKEILRKFRNTSSDFINLILENSSYKLYKFC